MYTARWLQRQRVAGPRKRRHAQRGIAENGRDSGCIRKSLIMAYCSSMIAGSYKIASERIIKVSSTHATNVIVARLLILSGTPCNTLLHPSYILLSPPLLHPPHRHASFSSNGNARHNDLSAHEICWLTTRVRDQTTSLYSYIIADAWS